VPPTLRTSTDICKISPAFHVVDNDKVAVLVPVVVSSCEYADDASTVPALFNLCILHLYIGDAVSADTLIEVGNDVVFTELPAVYLHRIASVNVSLFMLLLARVVGVP
jgi:hypothetical protein